MTNPSDLTTAEFSKLHTELKRKIADETPLHYEEGPAPGVPYQPNVQGKQADIDEANKYLERWYQFATDGELGMLSSVGGETPWATLHNARNTLSQAKTDLGSVKDNIANNWTGAAAGEYVKYLEAAQRRFDDFVNGDDHCVDRARGLLREAYAAEAGFKGGLHELATAASAAIDTFAAQKAQIELTTVLGVGAIAAGAALSAATGGVAGAILGSVASTFSGEIFAAGKNGWDVLGKEPVEIMRSLDGHVTTLQQNYAGTAADIAAKMGELVTDLRSYTKQRKLELPPEVEPSGTSFSLKDFFPKDAAGDDDVTNRIDHAK